MRFQTLHIRDEGTGERKRGTAGFPGEADREGMGGGVKLEGVCHMGRLGESLRWEEGLSWRPADGPLQTMEADRCSHKELLPHSKQRRTLQRTEIQRQTSKSEAAVHPTTSRGSNKNSD